MQLDARAGGNAPYAWLGVALLGFPLNSNVDQLIGSFSLHYLPSFQV
jgi:hypothetical protein